MARVKSKKAYVKAVYLVLAFIAGIWIIEIVNIALDHWLCNWGIYPRSIAGLPGILLSPLLHFGLEHVLMNTLPFIILGGFIIIRHPGQFIKISLLIIILGGIGVWVLGRSAYHVGASGLVFGYFGFIVARGWYERSLGSIIIAILAILIYGGMVMGIVPLFAYISWEAHLFGFLAGIFAARVLK
jgi:membrane associated rhomboid family serine protease